MSSSTKRGTKRSREDLDSPAGESEDGIDAVQVCTDIPDGKVTLLTKLDGRGGNTRQRILQKNNMTVFDVPGDGNCGISAVVIGAGWCKHMIHDGNKIDVMTDELWGSCKRLTRATLQILENPDFRAVLQEEYVESDDRIDKMVDYMSKSVVKPWFNCSEWNPDGWMNTVRLRATAVAIQRPIVLMFENESPAAFKVFAHGMQSSKYNFVHNSTVPGTTTVYTITELNKALRSLTMRQKADPIFIGINGECFGTRRGNHFYTFVQSPGASTSKASDQNEIKDHERNQKHDMKCDEYKNEPNEYIPIPDTHDEDEEAIAARKYLNLKKKIRIETEIPAKVTITIEFM